MTEYVDRCNDNFYQGVRANLPKFMQAVAALLTPFLSDAETRQLEEQTDKRTKDDTARAWGAAEDACDNNYLIDHGSSEQAGTHRTWKLELSELEYIGNGKGVMRLPLSGEQMPDLHFSRDTPVKVYLWDDGYAVKKREVCC